MVSRLYLVRHGRAEAGFGESMDPALDATGRAQADAVAQRLAPKGPMAIVSSPLRRARETAAPLAAMWETTPLIEQSVAEIPSPKGLTLEERVVWLRALMAGFWRGVSLELAEWRQSCIAAAVAMQHDSVIFSHFIAINVLAGAALADDRVVVFSPDNCSVTVFETDGVILRLVERGAEASLTKVN